MKRENAAAETNGVGWEAAGKKVVEPGREPFTRKVPVPPGARVWPKVSAERRAPEGREFTGDSDQSPWGRGECSGLRTGTQTRGYFKSLPLHGREGTQAAERSLCVGESSVHAGLLKENSSSGLNSLVCL